MVPHRLILPLLAGLSVSPAMAADQEPDLARQVELAWAGMRSYCGSFTFAVWSQQNVALSRGKTCWQRPDRLLTETDSPLGPVVEIRDGQEVWYYDPARPLVVHMKAEGLPASQGLVTGQGLGELVELLQRAQQLRPLPSQVLDGRPTKVVECSFAEDQGQAVLFVDDEHGIPVAAELRSEGRAVVSYGITDLQFNPQLDDSVFRIRPLYGVPQVDISFDASAMTPAEAAKRTGLP